MDPHELKKLRARELELKRILHAFEEKARFKRQAREQKQEKVRAGEAELEKQKARVREQTDEEKWSRSRRKYGAGLTPKSMKEMSKKPTMGTVKNSSQQSSAMHEEL